MVSTDAVCDERCIPGWEKYTVSGPFVCAFLSNTSTPSHQSLMLPLSGSSDQRTCMPNWCHRPVVKSPSQRTPLPPRLLVAYRMSVPLPSCFGATDHVITLL